MEIGLVELSRLQFAMTALYHFLFVPLTLGLSILVATLRQLPFNLASRPVRRRLCNRRSSAKRDVRNSTLPSFNVTMTCPFPIIPFWRNMFGSMPLVTRVPRRVPCPPKR